MTGRTTPENGPTPNRRTAGNGGAVGPGAVGPGAVGSRAGTPAAGAARNSRQPRQASGRTQRSPSPKTAGGAQAPVRAQNAGRARGPVRAQAPASGQALVRRQGAGNRTNRLAHPVVGGAGRRALAHPTTPVRTPADPVRRSRLVVVLAVLVVMAVAGRLVWVQIYRGPALAAVALAERSERSETLPHRGDITDINGAVLATTVDRYTIAADQKAIDGFKARAGDIVDGKELEDGGPVGVAKLLSPVLDIPAPQLAADLMGNKRYKVLKRDVTPTVQRQIKALNLSAYIITEKTSKRQYPAKSVAGNLVGLVTTGDDGALVGRGGIESVYNDVLTGTRGVAEYERGRKGQQIPTGATKVIDPVPGRDVKLTVDRDVQWKAQDAIDAAVTSSGAEWAIAVVQDVQTGALLALADSGTVDPNDRSTAKAGEASRAVSNIFEPGSTAKVITMAEVLEGGHAKPETPFTVPYMYTTPNGQTFKDSHEHGTLQLTLAGILAQSSNTGTVQVGERVPKQVRYDYLRKFGFGQSTGLGLPGESKGILHPAAQWDGRTRYTVLFGQGLAVNAVQATSVLSTVANGGVRLTPHLVDGTVAADGTYAPAPAAESSQVISATTASTLLRMMESVVEGGSGTKAAVPGYRVAGKTGTAQIKGCVGAAECTLASFIGVAPADAPRYTVSVFVKDPRTSVYGGDVAAPVFADLMGFTLTHEGVPPSTKPYVPYPLTW